MPSVLIRIKENQSWWQSCCSMRQSSYYLWEFDGESVVSVGKPLFCDWGNDRKRWATLKWWGQEWWGVLIMGMFYWSIREKSRSRCDTMSGHSNLKALLRLLGRLFSRALFTCLKAGVNRDPQRGKFDLERYPQKAAWWEMEAVITKKITDF